MSDNLKNEPDSLENDLPVKETACVTDLEAICLQSEPFYRQLRRSVEVIKRHAETCEECKSRLARANANLERDKSKVTQLITEAIPRKDSKVGGSETFPSQSVSSSNGKMTQGIREGNGHGVQSDTQSETTGLQHDPNRDYAVSRLSEKNRDKELVATYVAERLPLSDGSGLFVDAGSQCLLAYDTIVERVVREARRHLHLVTSNKFVLDSWEKDPKARARFPTIEIAGSEFDVSHRAFYGLSVNRGFDSFRPSLALIGASGFEVGPGRLWLGTHAGPHEIADKQRLFKFPAKKRVILLVPGKIGNAGSKPLDLLAIKGCAEGPIYIVTAAPKHPEHKQSYNNAIKAMHSKIMIEKLERQGITVHWITIYGVDDQNVGQIQENIFPSKAEPKMVLLDAEACRADNGSPPGPSQARSLTLAPEPG